MQVSVHEAKTQLSKLIEAVERGERVVITRYGTPTVELTPYKTSKVRFGRLEGKVAPPPDDFFDPLSEEELKDWGAI